jgi:hypothetical protein
MATIYDLYIDQGSDFVIELIVQTDDGNIIPLDGFDIYSQFRKSAYTTNYFSFDCGIVGDPSNGVISLTLLGDDSSAIKAGRYLYDVEIQDPINNIKARVIQGMVDISPEMTRTITVTP